MRQCRFCGHINDNALIYCISCDSPLDPTTQSRIPEELRRAIERNKQGLPLEAPAAPVADASPAATIQDMRASDISLPPLRSSTPAPNNPGMYNPGQSYEMTSIPVIHQSSGEVVSPYFTPDSATSLDPSTPTQVQPPPAEPEPPRQRAFQASMPAIPEPPPGPPVPHVPPSNPFQSIPSSPTQSLPLQPSPTPSPLPPPNKEFLPVSPTTEYRSPGQEAPAQENWEELLPNSARSAPNPLLPKQTGPSPYEDMSVPSAWESQAELSLSSHQDDIYNQNGVTGGLRFLSNFLVIVLMVVSGGFISIFVYMYWFSESDNIDKTKEVWRPLERTRMSPRPRRLQPQPPRIDPLPPLRRMLGKAQGDIHEQEWEDARKKLKLILASKAGVSLHPQAQALLAKVEREEKASQLLKLSQNLAKRKRWRQTLRPLYQIPSQTHAHRKALGLRKLLERKYLRRRMRRIRRNQRRRRYKQAFRGLRSLLLATPHYTPARKRFASLAQYVERKRSRCLSYCSRRYHRQRRKRGWCRYACRRRNPKPPKIPGLEEATQPQLVASSVTKQPEVRPQVSSTASCNKRCSRHKRRQNACFRRYRRRFRYWCRHRCRKKHRGSKRRRCYRSCNRNGYNRIVRRKCRRSRRLYQRCRRNCK